MYESFLSTPGGSVPRVRNTSVSMGELIILINKLLGDFPCEARLEMTINACILVDWFFQVQFPKKMKRDTNEFKVQKRYLSGQP